MWTNNEDGTFTAQEGDTLWGLYGKDWKEKSGYTGDPTKLQPGQVVGKGNATITSITGGANSKNAQSPSLPTFSINQNQYYDSNGNLVLVGTALPNQLETAGDALSDAALGLNIAEAGCVIAGQFAVAEGCGTVAAICDGGALCCYLAAGSEKTIGAAYGVGLDLVPLAAFAIKPSLKPAYNMAAKRFINASTSRFITNAAGYRNYLSGPATGIIYSIYSNNKD